MFAKDLSELGCCKNVYEHKIDTGDAKPIRQRFYRTNPKQRAEIDRQVQEMLKNNIIEPSNSEWSSPVVLVKKKCGTFRKINKVTKPEIFPLPRLDDMLDSIGEANAKYFSVIDMASSFWQIPLEDSSKPKTAFVTHNGLYQFRTLPFGLTNAAMSFQMVTSKVLQGLTWKNVLCYIDDILVFSSTLDEHFVHLQEVFDRLTQATLRLKPEKCTFVAKRVKYLGHVITKDGIEVDEGKTAAVSNFPRPKNVHDVRSFLGLCNYYRRFIRRYGDITTPLSKLLLKDIKFEWTDTCENAFNSLKTELTSTPVLAYPNMNKPFILSTDASGESISYKLSQNDEKGMEHPIAYMGRTLRPLERKYSISERECLALVEGVRQYTHFLEHQHFTVVTDHSALKWLRNIKHSSGRLSRWSLLLQGFDFDVIHKPGKSHQNADVLSRIKYQDNVQSDDCDISSLFDIEPAVVTIEFDHPGQYTTQQALSINSVTDQNLNDNEIITIIDNRMDEIKVLQSECPDLNLIYVYLSCGNQQLKQ